MTEYEANNVLDSYIKLPEVFKFYGVEIKFNNFCCCPFHHEKTPSCKVGDYIYHCFGCGAKGNAVSFVKNYFNLDFKTAVQKLNYDFGLNLLDTKLTEEQKKKVFKRKKEIYERQKAENEVEQIKNQYFEAWKHYLYFKPDEKHYNIDTPEYLIDDYFNEIDPRWWKAKQILDNLADYAKLHDFYLEEFEARHLFLEFKPRIYTEKDCALIKIGKLVHEFNEQRMKK